MGKNEYIKRALQGDKKYHEIMTYFAHNDLINRAAIVPDNTGDIELPKRNYIHWMTNHIIINAGQMWCVHAVDVCEHYGSKEAHKIWRYGQVIRMLRFADNYCYHPDWLRSVVKNCGNYWIMKEGLQWNIGDAFFDKVYKDFGLIWINSTEPFLDDDDNEIYNDELRDTVLNAIMLIRYVYRGTDGMSSDMKKKFYSLANARIKLGGG